MFKFIYYNNPHEPKAYHTLEFQYIHYLNGFLKLLTIIIATLFADYNDMTFRQGFVIVVLSLIAESLIYRKMFHWKKNDSISLSVNILVAYLIGLCIWFASIYALDAFNVGTVGNVLLSLFVITTSSIAIKIHSLLPDLPRILPFGHRNFKGRFISACIYDAIIITTGIIISLLIHLPSVRTMTCITCAIFMASYMIFPVKGHIRIKRKVSITSVFINRLSLEKRRKYRTLVLQFHKACKLSDLEQKMLDKHPELKPEYDEIKQLVEDLMEDLLSPAKRNGRYYDEKIANLLSKQAFFERLNKITEDYIKQMEEEKERREREEREHEERRRHNKRQKEQNEQNRYRRTGYSGYTFFYGIKDSNQLTREYRKLVKRYHPDSPTGDHDKFIALQAEYEKLKEILKCA